MGKKSSKVDLAREASSLALSEALKVMLANSRDAMAKRCEMKRLEKKATIAIYINLVKEAPIENKHCVPIRKGLWSRLAIWDS
jgi:Mg2+/Co2+ transporter CorC